MLVEMFAQCGRFDYTLSNSVRAEERRRLEREGAGPGGQAKSPAVARSVAAKGVYEDDEGSSDEDDEMGEASATAGGTPREGGEEGMEMGPDADGWETVPNRKGGKGRRR